MTNGLLGQKLGMTQVFLEGGQTVPVTVIEAGPCRVSQVKTKERDGYTAVQLAFRELLDRKASKPVKGHFAKANLPTHRHVREFRATGETQVGATITVSMFTKGELVDIVGVSTQALEVIDVRPEEHLLFVRGAVPGARGSLVAVQKSKKAS